MTCSALLSFTLKLSTDHLENQIPSQAGKSQQWLCDDPGPPMKLEPTSPCIFLEFQTSHLVQISSVGPDFFCSIQSCSGQTVSIPGHFWTLLTTGTFIWKGRYGRRKTVPRKGISAGTKRPRVGFLRFPPACPPTRLPVILDKAQQTHLKIPLSRNEF